MGQLNNGDALWEKYPLMHYGKMSKLDALWENFT